MIGLPDSALRDSAPRKLPPRGERVGICLQFARRMVHLLVWEINAGWVELHLLDTNGLMNDAADRGITSVLCAAAPEMRQYQQMMLGIVGRANPHNATLRNGVCAGTPLVRSRANVTGLLIDNVSIGSRIVTNITAASSTPTPRMP